VDGISLNPARQDPGHRRRVGSGKSTLGQAILRLLDSEGSIRFQGKPSMA
jgi:microcin C transport system ATP-binding protein